MTVPDKNLSALIEISHFYGSDKDYVIAGGGNTSYKNESDIWVKASGTSLGDITISGFAVLQRQVLAGMYDKPYSSDPDTREAEVKADLYSACHSGTTVRPSVETSLHEIIRYPLVVHTHPTLVNALMCANLAEEKIRELFGDEIMFVPYTDPGYILFQKIRTMLLTWRKTHPADPHVIFLQNHGVFVSADSAAEIKTYYRQLETIIKSRLKQVPDLTPADVPADIVRILPGLRMLFSGDSVKVATIRNNAMIARFAASKQNFTAVSLPFTPDQIVYCKARPVYLEQSTPEAILDECRQKIASYLQQYGHMPKMAVLKGYGIIAFENNIKSAETMLDVFEDWMKISMLTDNFGGPHFLSDRDIAFIDNWEVENYRRQVSKEGQQKGKAENKTVIVTGGAQGFGSGIAEAMMHEGANVIIADLNEDKGNTLVRSLNQHAGKNAALFVHTNVTEPSSVENLMLETVKCFGGLDVLICNAGILRAGDLEEMSPETFDMMTRVNYSAYFLCTRYAARIMKLQWSLNPEYFMDIVQINSKSGLKGSNKNFAYAGGKFGGIGLTQSFALELMPYRIKVNSICPGNFFEGPLWSDPETGLFVQYLRTGKVPGAKTISDVKAYYEKMVPAGRGCRVSDLMKALFYVIDQEYETGQAVPVTGGQEMLR